MNLRYKILLILLFGVLLGGCHEIPNPFAGEKVLARTGRLTLRVADVEKVFPVGVTGADSVAWVASYVDRWVRDNLKLQEAQRLFGTNDADEKLIDAYRNSLKTRRLEQYFVESATGDSLYTDRDLRSYYGHHKGDFVLDRSIVKGRVVAFPSTFRQKARLKELMAADRGDSRRELEAMVSKNGFTFTETAGWMEYAQFLTLLPTRRNASYENLLARKGVQEMTDGGSTWWFVLDEARTPGTTSPYEMVREMVRWTVEAKRKAEIVKRFEDSIYNAALHEKVAVVNL